MQLNYSYWALNGLINCEKEVPSGALISPLVKIREDAAPSLTYASLRSSASDWIRKSRTGNRFDGLVCNALNFVPRKKDAPKSSAENVYIFAFRADILCLEIVFYFSFRIRN